MSNQSDSLESLVIGDGVIVKGTFVVPSKAVINGVIEGDLTAEEVLIGITGRITGRVSAKVIDVRGQLHNAIISERSLIVRSTGKIAGKVHYSEIEIEKGGEIEGSLSQDSDVMGTTTAPSVNPTSIAKSAPQGAIGNATGDVASNAKPTQAPPANSAGTSTNAQVSANSNAAQPTVPSGTPNQRVGNNNSNNPNSSN